MPYGCTCRSDGAALCPRCAAFWHYAQRSQPAQTQTQVIQLHRDYSIEREPATPAGQEREVRGKRIRPLSHANTTTRRLDNSPPALLLPPGAAMGTQLPLRLTAMKHHGHWTRHHKAVRFQRQYIYERLRSLWEDGPVLGLPLVVTITRIAPRALDGDNLQLACSAVRDGISDWLAGEYLHGEDRQEGLEFRYNQRSVAPRFYAVEIRVERPKR